MKSIRTEIKWGIIFTLSALLWMVVEKLSGLHSTYIEKHFLLTNIFSIIAILIYVLALRDKRNILGGFMTWREGFLTGMIVAAVVLVLSPVAQWITHNVISPEYFPNIIEYSVSQGELTQEEAEKYFNLGSYIKQSMAGAMLMGIVTSAVVAVFLKKKPPQES